METLEKTIRRAIEDLKRRSEKEDVYQMNVDLMKDELEKKILENESLTKQQNVLKAKLEKVELNACDAIQHIMALKYFAEKFNIVGTT